MRITVSFIVSNAGALTATDLAPSLIEAVASMFNGTSTYLPWDGSDNPSSVIDNITFVAQASMERGTEALASFTASNVDTEENARNLVLLLPERLGWYFEGSWVNTIEFASCEPEAVEAVRALAAE